MDWGRGLLARMSLQICYFSGACPNGLGAWPIGSYELADLLFFRGRGLLARMSLQICYFSGGVS